IGSGDRFRTWSRKTARTNHAVLNDEGQSHFVKDRRVDHAHWIGNRLTIRTNTGASLIGESEIRELEYELAVSVRRVCLDDVCLPTGRSTINCAGSQGHARFRILPDRTRWLDHQAGIETSLLVSRRSKVVVGENGAESTVFPVVVESIVGKPPLHGCLCVFSAEKRMQFAFRTGKRAVAGVTRLGADATILFANSNDPFPYLIRAEGSVFIVEAVT